MAQRRSAERLVRALHALAAELAAEKRQVMLLRRENRALKARLASLQASREKRDNGVGGSEDAERVARYGERPVSS